MVSIPIQPKAIGGGGGGGPPSDSSLNMGGSADTTAVTAISGQVQSCETEHPDSTFLRKYTEPSITC